MLKEMLHVMKNRLVTARPFLVTLGAAALLLALLVFPNGALAHARLTSSSPADGSTVAPGLTAISLTFGEETSVDQSNAQLMGADGNAVSGATSAVDRSDRTKMTISTPALAEGKYTVKWHTVTEDDNGIADGTFSFTVAASSGTGATTQSSSGTSESLPEAGAGQSATVMVLLALGALALAATGVSIRRRATR
jgi:methionine-rich copper-binding protein CopC